MRLSTLMVINAVVAILFGLAFLLAPGPILGLYGVTADAPMRSLGQLFGAALVAFAVLSWMARHAVPSGARRAIVVALFVGAAIGFVVSLMGQLAGTYNALGWSSVAIYLLLAVGFGYFTFSSEGA